MGFVSLGRTGSSCPWGGSGLVLCPATAAEVVIPKALGAQDQENIPPPPHRALGKPFLCSWKALWEKLLPHSQFPPVSDPCV